jgi:glyoxylase-like metal-dependent hydrolase (beta-lactamase superfamily II)
MSENILARREFVSLAALGIATTASGVLPRFAFAAPRIADTFDWKPVGQHARVAFGSGGNSLVVARRGEALLVDTKVAGFGAILRREANVAGAAVRLVVNTHHHGDHVGGNDAFTPNALTVGQAKQKERIIAAAAGTLQRLKGAPVQRYADALRQSGFDVRLTPEGEKDIAAFISAIESTRPEAFSPSETFDTERELRVGDFTVQLHHVSAGHTDNDVIVFVPEMNILHAGDLLFHRHNTFVDTSVGATTLGWDRCLAAAINMCNASTSVIAGHGEVTDRRGLQEQRDYFNKLRDVVTAAMKDGKSRADIITLKPTEFAQHAWPELLSATLGVLYDELSRSRQG